MQSGAMSTERIVRGSLGTPGPPAMAMLRESSACRPPWDAPPTWALPPGTSNSQPG